MRRKIRKFRGGGMDASKPDFGGGGGSGNGRNPSKQYETKTTLSKQARENLGKQTKGARESISPSTKTSNKIIALGLGLTVPGAGYFYKKAVDSTAMGFGKVKKNNTKKMGGGDGGSKGTGQNVILPKKITPVEATKPIDTNLIKPKDNFFNFVAYKVGGLSGGVSYGPPPKRGPNSQVPPVKMKRGGKK